MMMRALHFGRGARCTTATGHRQKIRLMFICHTSADKLRRQDTGKLDDHQASAQSTSVNGCELHASVCDAECNID